MAGKLRGLYGKSRLLRGRDDTLAVTELRAGLIHQATAEGAARPQRHVRGVLLLCAEDQRGGAQHRVSPAQLARDRAAREEAGAEAGVRARA